MPRWIILRTSGGQTLPLMRSLCGEGVDAWSPARTIRRVTQRGRPSERRFDIDVPILPTFVFAPEAQIATIDDAASDPSCRHPAFSIFRHGGRIPLIAESEIAGLRGEEESAAAVMQAIRDAETHQAAEIIRISAIKSEAARRRATKEMERARMAELRTHRVKLLPGTSVDVADMPALAGVTGVIESIDGSIALVRFGTLSWKIEGWRLSPSSSDTSATRGLAA